MRIFFFLIAGNKHSLIKIANWCTWMLSQKIKEIVTYRKCTLTGSHSTSWKEQGRGANNCFILRWPSICLTTPCTIVIQWPKWVITNESAQQMSILVLDSEIIYSHLCNNTEQGECLSCFFAVFAPNSIHLLLMARHISIRYIAIKTWKGT